jgi:Family of unknown function (DUF6221)
VSDLVEFLRARLDEDEAVAQAAVIPAHDAPNAYKPHPPLSRWRYSDGGEVEIDYDDPGPYPEPWRVTQDSEGLSPAICYETHGHHIARYDPARILAEVDAKRRIIEHHRPDDICDEACTTLRLLALPYADDPDYRDEWKPN